MSTGWIPDKEMKFSEVVENLPPGLTCTTHANFTAWVRTSVDSPNRLALMTDNCEKDTLQFERFGANDVGSILQLLADQHDVTFTCELGLERVAPGGEGIVEIYA